MKFKEYQEKALQTALYNTVAKKLLCPAIGLGTELEEYLTAKLEGSRKDQTKEIGDCMWYLAAFANHLDVHKLKYIPNIEENIYDLSSLHQGFMEMIKKTVRDYDFVVPDKYRDDMVEFLYVYYSILIDEMEKEEMNIVDIMEINLAKLKDRQERNVLSGDGDNR